MLGAYLQLLRPANVATTVADILAGFAVAGQSNPSVLPWLIAASACLYGGGVVLNDVFDRKIDAIERPERPLPSGRIPVDRAAWFGAGLLVGGVLCALAASTTAAGVAVATAGAVLLYDAGGKHHGVIGPLNMGVCRGLNLVLGMSAVPATIGVSWRLALITVVYIAAVTLLSRGEVSGGGRGRAALALVLLALVVIALGGLALREGPSRQALAGLALTGLLAWRVLPPFLEAYRDSSPSFIRQAVRAGILSLVLVDAVIAASYAGISYSVGVLATAAVAGYLARSFAVT